MAEKEDVEFISPHQYIKNATTNGKVLTEFFLNTSWRLQTPKRTKKKKKSPCNQKGWKKKKKRKEKRNQKRDQQSSRRLQMKKAPSLNKSKPTLWLWGNQLGQKRTYSRAKENTADDPWKAEQSKNWTHGLCCNPCTSQNVSCCRGGLGVEKWGLKHWSREGTAVHWWNCSWWNWSKELHK